MAVASVRREAVLVGDIGSTFTKLVAIGADGEPVSTMQAPTDRAAIAEGVERALGSFRGALAGDGTRTTEPRFSSSAGGGLRVTVVGIEPKLTLDAGRRASATAGARIVASYAAAELRELSPVQFNEAAPDMVLLTGGTNGGARDVVDAALELEKLAPELPTVVAANESLADEVATALGNRRLVRFAANVMPKVGELESADVQTEIRKVFVEHVIGGVKLAASEQVAAAVRMPTPAAVLEAAQALAESGRNPLRRPVIVDLGGATTDVHSVLALDESDRGYARPGLGNQRVTRTVEGDLGMRESAPALVATAQFDGLLGDRGAEAGELARAAARRAADRSFVPETDEERANDERLAGLATEIAVMRHAGVARTRLTPDGAVLTKTGRDLRRASCVIATGGVFRHSPRAHRIVAEAWERVAARGGLVKAPMPVFVDRSYLLWAVGLLRAEAPRAMDELLAASLVGDGE